MLNFKLHSNFVSVKNSTCTYTHTQTHTHLSTKGSREAIIKSQDSIALHHMNSHPKHPLLHLLLCLQVHLGRQTQSGDDVIFITMLSLAPSIHQGF